MEFKPDLPVHHRSMGIIDADSIMFFLGWQFDKLDLEPEPTYPAEEYVQAKCREFHEKLLLELGVSELTYHFTGSGRNRHMLEGAPEQTQFRTDIATEAILGYKENREFTFTPTGYAAVLKTFLFNYNSIIHFDIEADDAVVALKRLHPTWVLASNDKDVYMQVPGKHYNYDKRKRWVTTTVNEANRMPYVQAITGDPVDGFKGAKRKGIAWVNKNMPLSQELTPSQMWKIVVRAFVEAKHTTPVADAIFNMRMASMHQWDGKELTYFEPPVDGAKHIFKESEAATWMKELSQ